LGEFITTEVPLRERLKFPIRNTVKRQPGDNRVRVFIRGG